MSLAWMFFLLGLATGLNVVSAVEEAREANLRAAGMHAVACAICALCAGLLAGFFGR